MDAPPIDRHPSTHEPSQTDLVAIPWKKTHRRRWRPHLSSSGCTSSDETISPADEKLVKQRRSSLPVAQTTGFDHVGPPPQRDLPPIPQGRPSRHGKPGSKAMTEVVTALI